MLSFYGFGLEELGDFSRAEDIDSLLAPLWRTYCLKYDEHVGEDDDEDEVDDDDEHEIMMLDGPICENVSQSLDMVTPKPRFWKGPDQLLLAGA